MLVLGDGPRSGHQRLADVAPGEGFAYLGRLYATRAAADGALELRQTGEVLSEVATTFVRQAPGLLRATLRLADGTETTVEATGATPSTCPPRAPTAPWRPSRPAPSSGSRAGAAPCSARWRRSRDPRRCRTGCPSA